MCCLVDVMVLTDDFLISVSWHDDFVTVPDSAFSVPKLFPKLLRLGFKVFCSDVRILQIIVPPIC